MKAQFEAGQCEVLLRLVGVDDVPWDVLDGLEGARVVVEGVGSVVVVGANVLRIVDDVDDAGQRERALQLATKVAVSGTLIVNGTMFSGVELQIVELAPSPVWSETMLGLALLLWPVFSG